MNQFSFESNALITTDEDLVTFCEQVGKCEVIAVDTEFMREKTYYAKLCLIQIASPTLAACVDPFSISDLGPLLEILLKGQNIKVFHSARQDLELFYDNWQKVPQPLFDTQIAATLLGYPDQIGYANLVQNLLDTQLDKSASRTDWSQRPLTNNQISYALDDVRYLIQLYPVMQKKLKELGRLEWLDNDFNALTQQELYTKDSTDSWKRVSGHGKLRPKQLNILKQLTTWREDTARKRNKPRKWVISDDVLHGIVRQPPDSVEKLTHIRGINTALVQKDGTDIVNLIKAANVIPESDWPSVQPQVRLTPDEDALADLMLTYLKHIAASQKISHTALATRKDIEKLAHGNHDIPLLTGWRKQMAGEAIIELLNGKRILRIKHGKVCAE
jgi:ribonuclease D